MLNIDLATILYNDIKKATQAFDKNCCINAHILSKHQIKRSDLVTSAPKPIYNYILSKAVKQFVYQCTIQNRQVTLYITSFNDDIDEEGAFDEWAKLMFIWLHMAFGYATDICAKALSVYLFPTPFEKKLPDGFHETLSPAHINTGVTWRCASVGEIVIYRKEEWFKVFIHETFHALGLDIAPHQVNVIRNNMRRRFPIASSFNIAEAYSEAWARIMNVAIYCFINTGGEKSFIKKCASCLELERKYSLFQMQKILTHTGLPYKSLRNDSPADMMRRRLYREKTNVFAYYVLGGILMSDPNAFMEWCYENNDDFLNFGENHKEFDALVDRWSLVEPQTERKFNDHLSTKMSYFQIK
jgi:hypothetical protein